MFGAPNYLAYLALFAWAPVCIVLYAALRPHRAAFLSLLGAALFLPSNFAIDVPFLTGIDKELIASLSALIGCLMLHGTRLRAAKPGQGTELLFVALFAGQLVTTFTNSDPLRYGPTLIPGETPYDALVVIVDIFIRYAIPFGLGRCLVSSSRELRDILTILAAAGLVYAVFAVYELNMGPNLNLLLYGYHQSDFIQAIRGDGFRPKIFMRHGLNVTLFLALATLSLLALARARLPIARIPTRPVFIAMIVLLLFCKSVGALIFTTIGGLVIGLLKPARIVAAAGGLSLAVIGYPMLRSFDLVPASEMVELVGKQLGPEKEQSLRTRFENEAELLGKAQQRLLFGWGGWGRARIYDPGTGENTSVTDGLWALEIGSRGLWGFLSLFGVLVTPILLAWKRLGSIRLRHNRYMISSLALLCAFYACDLIPNSSVDGYLTFLCGSLAGSVPGIEREEWRRAKRQKRRVAETAFADLAKTA